MADTNKYDPDDYWAQAVTQYTGYSMPSRKGLFEKLKSKEGIPLMRVNLVEHYMRAVDKNDYAASSGWEASHGETYRLAFYTHHGEDKVRLFTADIVFIGTLADASGGNHLSDPGSTREGGAFKGKYGDEWDDGDLWRYVSAPKFALDTLVNDHRTTHFSYNGVTVEDAQAVDLTSFDRTAAAFDRAAQFFRDQLKPLEVWNKSLGGDDAAWKGQSADVVRSLIASLHKNYEGYAEQMGGLEYNNSGHRMLDGHVPTSNYSDLLFQAQWDLHWEAREMQAAWSNWADSGEHDPHRALLEQLDAVRDWILTNNVPLVLVKGSYDAVGADDYDSDKDEDLLATEDGTFDTAPGFSDNPGFGALDDLNTWKTIGEQAVKRWNDNVEGYLVAAARESLARLGSGWSDAAEGLQREVTTKSTDTLTSDYEKKQTASEKEASQKALDDANKKSQEALNNLSQSLSDSSAGNKDLFDSLNNNLADSAANQKQLNSSLTGLGDSFSDGLDDLGDSVTQSLNPGTGDLGLDTDASLLDGGLDSPAGDIGALNDLSDLTGTGDGDLTVDPLTTSDSPLDTGTTLPLNALSTSLPNTSTSTSTSSPLNTGLLDTDGPYVDADGNLVQTYPDGTQTVYDPDTGQLVTTGSDGRTTTTQLNPGDVITNPDGSQTQLNADGTLTTEFPDGTTQVFDPSDSTLDTVSPDGTRTTTQLNSSGATSLLNTGAGTGYSDLLGSSDLLDYGDTADYADYADYDSTPFTGGTLGGVTGGYGLTGADLSSSAASGGGTPLNSGFGGAGAGAGAGAGGTNGERVRSVLNDGGNVSALRRTGSVASAVDGEDLPVRRGQTTSSPMGGGAPMGGAQGGQSTESGDRQRTNWVEEDEDVWGTDEGAAPAVLG
ncbi:AAWKG family protein [Streptomyces sp. NPDC088812]|uniref:AAWKG family protein n=1 Tax=Streptomyces sp. NPDC088812 TaxID=3365905 RepID=UPI0037F4A9A7